MITIPKTAEALRSTSVPAHIFLPRGMIVPEEQTLLYLLARDVWSGTGEIVDAGAFCGASAYAFAAGMCDNGGSMQRAKRIHSFDLFIVDNDYTRDYIQNGFYFFTGPDGEKKFRKREVIFGESFLDVFLFQTQRYSEQIVARPGSILDFIWPEAPIEVLFVDVAKTLEVQKHLFRSFLLRLLPGGVLIQQDFHHAWHPYIHVAMEYLTAFFEVTHSQVCGSRAYRLDEPIPEIVLRRVADHDFSTPEVAELMARCVAHAPTAEQPLLQVVQARQMMLSGDAAGVKQLVRSFVDRWQSLSGFDWYLSELKAAAGPVAASELQQMEL